MGLSECAKLLWNDPLFLLVAGVGYLCGWGYWFVFHGWRLFTGGRLPVWLPSAIAAVCFVLLIIEEFFA